MPFEVNSIRKTVLFFQNISLSSIQVILMLAGKYCSNDPAKISWLIGKIAQTMCFVYFFGCPTKTWDAFKKTVPQHMCILSLDARGRLCATWSHPSPQKKPTSPLPFPRSVDDLRQKPESCNVLNARGPWDTLGTMSQKNAITPWEQEDIGGAFHGGFFKGPMLIRCDGLPAAAGWEKPGIFCCLEEPLTMTGAWTQHHDIMWNHISKFHFGASGKSSLSTIKKKNGISKDAQDYVCGRRNTLNRSGLPWI